MLTNARRPSMVCMLRAPALPTAGVCGSVASRAQTAQSGIHCAALHTLQRMRPVVRRRCARDVSRDTPQRAWRGTALRRAHTSRAVRQRDHHDGVERGRGSGNGAQVSEAAEGSGVRDGESSSAGASGGDGDDEYPRSRLFRVVKTTVLAVVGLSMFTAIENVQGPYCASARRWLADVHLRLVESVAGLMGNDAMKKEARTQRQKMAKQQQQEAAAAAKLPTKFMTVDGKKIAYYDSGVGSPVVVVNSTTSTWRWRVCAVSRWRVAHWLVCRGHGLGAAQADSEVRGCRAIFLHGSIVYAHMLPPAGSHASLRSTTSGSASPLSPTPSPSSVGARKRS